MDPSLTKSPAPAPTAPAGLIAALTPGSERSRESLRDFIMETARIIAFINQVWIDNDRDLTRVDLTNLSTMYRRLGDREVTCFSSEELTSIIEETTSTLRDVSRRLPSIVPILGALSTGLTQPLAVSSSLFPPGENRLPNTSAIPGLVAHPLDDMSDAGSETRTTTDTNVSVLDPRTTTDTTVSTNPPERDFDIGENIVDVEPTDAVHPLAVGAGIHVVFFKSVLLALDAKLQTGAYGYWFRPRLILESRFEVTPHYFPRLVKNGVGPHALFEVQAAPVSLALEVGSTGGDPGGYIRGTASFRIPDALIHTFNLPKHSTLSAGFTRDEAIDISEPTTQFVLMPILSDATPTPISFIGTSWKLNIPFNLRSLGREPLGELPLSALVDAVKTTSFLMLLSQLGSGLAITVLIGGSGLSYLVFLRAHLRTTSMLGKGLSILCLRGVTPAFPAAILIRLTGFLVERKRLRGIFLTGDRFAGTLNALPETTLTVFLGKTLYEGMQLLTAGLLVRLVLQLKASSKADIVLMSLGFGVSFLANRSLRQWIDEDI